MNSVVSGAAARAAAAVAPSVAVSFTKLPASLEMTKSSERFFVESVPSPTLAAVTAPSAIFAAVTAPSASFAVGDRAVGELLVADPRRP